MVCVALCVVGWTGSREAGGRGEWKEESHGQRRLAGWGGVGPWAVLEEGLELQ